MIVTGKNLTPSLQEQIELLLATPVGTVVLDREFGINTKIIDEPLSTVETQAAEEIAVKLEKYIPEVKLDRVKLRANDAQSGKAELEVIVKNAD